MKKYIFCAFVLLVSTIAFIFSLSLQDAPTSNALSQKTTEAIATVIEVVPDAMPPLSNNFIRSLAHIGLFFLLGCVTLLTCTLCQIGYQKSLYRTALVGLLTALCDELIQLSSPGRAFEWADLGKDGFGILCSLILFSIVHFLFTTVRQMDTKKS